MSWEQEISEKLQEAQSIAVRFDTAQELTGAQKTTAKNNIGINASVAQIANEDHKIVFNY